MIWPYGLYIWGILDCLVSPFEGALWAVIPGTWSVQDVRVFTSLCHMGCRDGVCSGHRGVWLLQCSLEVGLAFPFAWALRAMVWDVGDLVVSYVAVVWHVGPTVQLGGRPGILLFVLWDIGK